jgi:hypothetical protein
MPPSISRSNSGGVAICLFVATCTALMPGCSSTTEMHPSSIEESNVQMKDRNAIIRLKDGREWPVKNVRRSDDSVSFQDRYSSVGSGVASREVDKITTVHTDHVLGAMEGLGIGFLGPFLVSMPIFAGTDDGGEIPWIAGPIAVGAAGGVVGLIVGAVSGFTYYDEFHMEQPNDSVLIASDSNRAVSSAAVTDSRLSGRDSRSEADSNFTNWDEQPKTLHSVLYLANLGAYWLAVPSDKAGIRGVADFGALLVVGTNDAIGVSVFASSDAANLFNAGAGFRYRRRVDSRQSFDFGIGMPLYGESSLTDYTASVYGLVKWNPSPWFGIALRPELRKVGGPQYEFAWPNYTVTKRNDPYRLFLSLGIEIGGSFGH